MDIEQKRKNFELAQELISEQNFAAAMIAGAVAMILAAVAYGVVVDAWPFSYGFAAAGVGVVIGFFMGFLGRGITLKFSVAAAIFTIIGCILGNLFVNVLNAARATAASPADVFQGYPLHEIVRWTVSGVSMIHYVFWFVAVVAAAFLARRPLSRAQRLAIGLAESRN